MYIGIPIYFYITEILNLNYSDNSLEYCPDNDRLFDVYRNL